MWLWNKHGTKYNEKQFNLWARMIVNKQEDLGEPPNIPLTGDIKKETLSEGAACAFAKALASREGNKPSITGHTEWEVLLCALGESWNITFQQSWPQWRVHKAAQNTARARREWCVE